MSDIWLVMLDMGDHDTWRRALLAFPDEDLASAHVRECKDEWERVRLWAVGIRGRNPLPNLESWTYEVVFDERGVTVHQVDLPMPVRDYDVQQRRFIITAPSTMYSLDPVCHGEVDLDERRTYWTAKVELRGAS